MIIDKDFNLVGQYPDILDIGKCGLDFDDLMDDPYANLVISDSINLKHIKVGSTFFNNNSVTIENCEKLKSIEIYEDGIELPAKYVICKNLPLLEMLKIRSDILSLEVEGCHKLNEINIAQCKKLAFLKVKSSDLLKKLNIQGCIKLSSVLEMDADEMNRLNLDAQINRNSEINGDLSYPLSNLNFKQVEKLLQLINGVDISKSKNTYSEYSILLLQPGEFTYTGGTGEVYAYELFDGDGYGEHSPEDCLETVMSRLINELGIQGSCRKEEFEVLFDYLNNFEKTSSSGSNGQVKTAANNMKNNISFHDQGWKSKSGSSVESVIQPGLTTGSMVMHNKFGIGKVLIIEGMGEDERASIDFVKHGTKWIALAFAKLTTID